MDRGVAPGEAPGVDPWNAPGKLWRMTWPDSMGSKNDVRFIRFFTGGETGLQWESVEFVDGQEPYIYGPFPENGPSDPLPEGCVVEPLAEEAWILARLSV